MKEEEFSSCCGAERWIEDTDICSYCMEHADFKDGELCRNGKPIDECNCC